MPDLKEGSMIFHPKFDFESYLLLMTKFFREQDVRKALQEMFNVRYAPCLFYEIAAHLFKHRFFDVIINFNFDELLDQSIREEMGVADYKIISDGDCKASPV
ncbi:MAG: hypothetical protein IPJ82_22550 [Lewinellaceae bacterium]|nr:hypothetical protein [Lewinellaceae bacterium]